MKKGRTVTWWNNADELAQKVTAALHKEIERTPRQGWMRLEDDNIANQPLEILRLIKENQKLSDKYIGLQKENIEHIERINDFEGLISQDAMDLENIQEECNELKIEIENLKKRNAELVEIAGKYEDIPEHIS